RAHGCAHHKWKAGKSWGQGVLGRCANLYTQNNPRFERRRRVKTDSSTAPFRSSFPFVTAKFSLSRSCDEAASQPACRKQRSLQRVQLGNVSTENRVGSKSVIRPPPLS